MDRDQKRADKAKRLAARRDGDAPAPEQPKPAPEPPAVDKDGKPILRVVPIRRGENRGER